MNDLSSNYLLILTFNTSALRFWFIIKHAISIRAQDECNIFLFSRTG